MRTFCTIISGNYFPHAATLYKSLIKFHEGEKLMVLVCDDGKINPDPGEYPGIRIFKIKDLYSYSITNVLYNKYTTENEDALRWAMKPVFLSWLLQNGYEKVIYVDCDIHFFNDYEFLYDELNDAAVLLTPSWRTIDPKLNEEEFVDIYTDGLYNAGFIGARLKGLSALQWWSKACSYRMAIDHESGLYNDQKYLDVLPVAFDDIHTIRNRGCNIAFWNQHECKRVSHGGSVLINNIYPIIFIHFNDKYIEELLVGNDHLIFPYYKQYETAFTQTGFSLKNFIPGLPEYKEPTTFIKMKRKLLIRTRIKKLLFKLIDKI
jgi:lipopolysaccharide biosynthesis glycosyltransferase